jgi:hypothetical protein
MRFPGRTFLLYSNLLFFGVLGAKAEDDQPNNPAAASDLPAYVFSAHRAGQAPGYKVKSLSNGDLHAENAGASFHSVALEFEPAQNNLSFKYWCTYRAFDGTGPEDGPMIAGACPAKGAEASHNVIAVRIELDKSDAKRYTLTYSCTQHGVEFKDVKAGEWCGKPDADKGSWIQKLDISLRRNQ